jgi:putative ABC transport system permease protein
MYFKLALKNLRKGFKDYTLYFLTLTFAVCIFYVFNSIEDQKIMMFLSQSASEMMALLGICINIFSVFISVILAFLIVYAKNFLIRRRKKEMGIYMTLGMEKSHIAKLLIIETFTIGVLSLCTGLFTGVFLSQGLAVIIARLFQIDLTGYYFVFSSSAFAKTCLYFGIIYLVVMIMGTISISKYRLIDLINAEKQNEKQKFKSPVVTMIMFILSIVCLGLAYGLVLKNGIKNFDKNIVIEVLLGALGTILFFASLSGFFLKLLQSNKKLYYKELNMFILRQINSRINTAYISMSFICLMLFCAIVLLSTALGFGKVITEGYLYRMPYDASFRIEEKVNLSQKLKEYGFDVYKYTDNPVECSTYRYTKDDLTRETLIEKLQKYSTENISRLESSLPLYLLKLTDYNELLKLQGKKPISLTENQVAFYSDYAIYTPAFKAALSKYMETEKKIDISGKSYELYPRVLADGLQTRLSGDLVVALVVSDEIAEGNEIHQTLLSFNSRENSQSMQQKLESDIYSFTGKNNRSKYDSKLSAVSKENVKAYAAGTKGIIFVIGIYLGVIFLITSAAILSLQQLSEAADNRHRYTILQKIGGDDRLVCSALFKQIAIYFMLPLALACVHSVVGIKVANDFITIDGSNGVAANAIIAAACIVVIYGSYFLATYFSSKRIVLG